MPLVYKYDKWNFIFLIVSCILVAIFFFKGVVFSNDSTVYINNGIKVLPLYPLLIDFFNFIFGSFGMLFLVVSQVSFALWAIYFFISTMDKNYNVDFSFKFIILLIMLIPIIKNGNYILSEMISYGLSIFFLTYIIKVVIDKLFYNMIYVLLFLMLIMRPQFKLALVLLVVFALLNFLVFDKKIKNFIIVLFGTVCMYFFSQIFVSTYNSHYNGMNDYIKLEGTNYITTQLYVSNKNSYKAIKEKDLRESLKKVLEKIDRDKASFKYVNSRSHFALGMGTLRNHFSDEFDNKKYLEKYGHFDDIKKRIAFQLMWENKIRYIKYIIRNAFTLTALSMFFVGILLFGAVYGMFQSNNSIFQIVFYIALFSLMNNFLIYAVSRFQFRYIYYSDFILLAIMAIFVNILIRNFIKNNMVGNNNE